MQDTNKETAAALEQGEIDPAGLTEAETALLGFAKILTETPAQTTDSDVEKLRQAGYDDSQIAEAVYVISMFAFFNRVADAFGLESPNYKAILEGKECDSQSDSV